MEQGNFWENLLERTRNYLSGHIPDDLPFPTPKLKDAFLIITVSQVVKRWSPRDRFYFWMYRKAFERVYGEKLVPVWKGNGVEEMKREQV